MSSNSKDETQNKIQLAYKTNSNIKEYISDYKLDKYNPKNNSDNQAISSLNTTTYNNNHNNNSINNNNNNSINNSQLLNQKYNYQRLPDISVTNNLYSDNQNELDQNRINQRSSGSLYRHQSEHINMFNPYTNKVHRSISQKILPQALILQQVKQARVNVQENNQILFNRLRKLREEEILLQKNVEETSKRAEKVFQQKKFYLKKKEEEYQKMSQQDEIAYTHPRKQLEMLKVQIAREEILKEKRKGAIEIKKQIADEQQIRISEEKAYTDNIKSRMEQAKKEKELSQAKKDQYYIQKKQKVEKDIYKQRMKEEILLSFTKLESKDYEKREQQMLEKIKQTQKVMQLAKDQLKDSITLDLVEYENRYQKDKKIHRSLNTSLLSSPLSSAKFTYYKPTSSKGVASNYNSHSISQQTLKINQNGSTCIVNNDQI